MTLRVSVAIGVVFFTAIALSALVGVGRRPPAVKGAVPIRSRGQVALVAFVLVAAGIALQLRAATRWGSVVLDWLPGVFLLAGYWLPAQLPRRPSRRLQAVLEETDRRLFDAGFARFLENTPHLLIDYLEAAYLCCYAVVPSALAWLYLAGQKAAADAFWTAVLLASLPCYALVAWFETRPPRVGTGPAAMPAYTSPVRRLNLVVLDRASIHVNTFPSGHAAASFAAALAVGAVLPTAGAVVGLLALSIAAGSVAGRYHYALDAVLGALAAVAAFGITRALF